MLFNLLLNLERANGDINGVAIGFYTLIAGLVFTYFMER